jgi:periplasmic protein CpxP/Spy
MTNARMMNSTTPVGQRGLKWLVAGVVLAVLATVALSAWADRGSGGHGMGGPGLFSGSPERMGHMIDHMLDGLNATDAQRSQIKQITEAAATDLKAQHEASRGLRQRGMQLFTAPNVDAAAAESLRQQMLAQHDQASKRVMQAMLDVSRVLTPEQRTKLGERMKMRADSWREHRHRMERPAPTQ